MDKNGYFQLNITKAGVFIKLFPPIEKGAPVDFQELDRYLYNRKLAQYDIKELHTAIANLEQTTEIKVSEPRIMQENETLELKISDDKMNVFGTFYPPDMNNGTLCTSEYIMAQLVSVGVKAGVCQETIQSFLQEREYCKSFVLAQGIKPTPGKDAYVEYCFSTKINTKPKLNEDGTVDYHQLDLICHVSKGDLLARLIKEDPGKPGVDVLGMVIKPNIVKKERLQFGKNIVLSEDRTEIYAEVTGHASVFDKKVFVSSVYEVPGDVDNSTGNIKFEGHVYVKGNVKNGFIVESEGDIIVDGVVEGATLITQGQIVLKRGIHGMTRGVLSAKGNVLSKFIENATVIAGGCVMTEAILHSKVVASDAIKVSGKKGFVTGGIVRAGRLIEAQTIGSNMGSPTAVEVGIDPEKKERFTLKKARCTEIEKKLAQSNPVLAAFGKRIGKGEKFNPQHLSEIQQLGLCIKELNKEFEDLKNELVELEHDFAENKDAKVRVYGTIYPGVTVQISDLNITLKEVRHFSQFVKSEGQIKIQTM